jgi:hypothetical protein
MGAPHESAKNLAEQLAAEAEKRVRTAANHAHGQEPAEHIRNLAQAVRLLTQAVTILAEQAAARERG